MPPGLWRFNKEVSEKGTMKAQSQPITKDLIAQHHLTDEEYGKIVEILGREPNLTEREL